MKILTLSFALETSTLCNLILMPYPKEPHGSIISTIKIDSKGIFFLAIYEMEALILADIDTFNRYYNLNYELDKEPIEYEKPKEFLKEQSNYKYKTSHCIKIFEVADFEKIYENHKGEYSFQSFINRLDDVLSHVN